MEPKIHVKKLDADAKLPARGRKGDAGLDLVTIESHILHPSERKIFSTGLAIALPEGYAGLIWDRSGLAAKHGLTVLAGVLDSTYRGEVKIVLLNTSDEEYEIKKGDRIGQLVVHEVPEFEITEADELPETVRGDGRFGSSGR